MKPSNGSSGLGPHEFVVGARSRRHGNHPRFIALGNRLEERKDRLEQGVLTSLEYLKPLLVITR